jgi:uncharacterized protein DUF4157
VSGHDHESFETDTLRPKAARLEDPDPGRTVRAALTGHRETLTPDGVLGLQRSAGNAGTAGLVEEERSPVHDVIASPGEPLARDVRADMEGRLGHDFSDVRVHTDSAADASAHGVNAHAYTVGSHVVFQRSAFDPGSHAGRTTVDGTPAVGGISLSDPSDRFEREASATAEQAMSMPASVQLQGVEAVQEEEPLQGSLVQRQEDEEAEEMPVG